MWTGAASGTGLGARPPGIGMRAGWQLWCKKCILWVHTPLTSREHFRTACSAPLAPRLPARLAASPTRLTPARFHSLVGAGSLPGGVGVGPRHGTPVVRRRLPHAGRPAGAARPAQRAEQGGRGGCRGGSGIGGERLSKAALRGMHVPAGCTLLQLRTWQAHVHLT